MDVRPPTAKNVLLKADAKGVAKKTAAATPVDKTPPDASHASTSTSSAADGPVSPLLKGMKTPAGTSPLFEPRKSLFSDSGEPDKASDRSTNPPSQAEKPGGPQGPKPAAPPNGAGATHAANTPDLGQPPQRPTWIKRLFPSAGAIAGALMAALVPSTIGLVTLNGVVFGGPAGALLIAGIIFVGVAFLAASINLLASSANASAHTELTKLRDRETTPTEGKPADRGLERIIADHHHAEREAAQLTAEAKKATKRANELNAAAKRAKAGAQSAAKKRADAERPAAKATQPEPADAGGAAAERHNAEATQPEPADAGGAAAERHSAEATQPEPADAGGAAAERHNAEATQPERTASGSTP